MPHTSACCPGRPPPASPVMPRAWGPITPSLRVLHVPRPRPRDRKSELPLCSRSVAQRFDTFGKVFDVET